MMIVNNMDLNLQNKEWKEFKIGEIFEVSKGIYLPSQKIKPGKIPYITAKSMNNGVTDFIENTPLFSGNCITIGKVDLSAYYQPTSFYCSHDVSVITNSSFNKYLGQFICKMINRQGFKYSYGRQAQLNVVSSEKVFLPINSQGNPDYAFMEVYVKQKEQEKLVKYNKFISKRLTELENYKEVGNIEDREWKEFFITDIFPEIQRGKRLKKANHQKGTKPYVSSTALNNGVDGYIGNSSKIRTFNNCLTIANSGSVGATFYQPYTFVASDHITKLENIVFNKYIYQFISTLTSRLSQKYSFNREINDTRIKREKIMLPINKNGQPDYDFMENYIKRLEYQKIKKYLDKKNLLFLKNSL